MARKPPGPPSAASKQFAQNLYKARMEKGWTQSELARRVWGETTDGRGYKVARNRDRVSLYERAAAEPTRENLELLAKTLGRDPEELAPGMAVPKDQRESLDLQMATLPRNPGKALLQVNMIVDTSLANKIIGLLSPELENSDR